MKKNEHKKGSQLKLSSNEMKGLKKYKEGYVEDVKEMFEAIKETVPYYTLEVYKEFVKMVSDYHTKYIQILGGTSFVKELVPVKKVINEATKYSVEFEWRVSFTNKANLWFRPIAYSMWDCFLVERAIFSSFFSCSRRCL